MGRGRGGKGNEGGGDEGGREEGGWEEAGRKKGNEDGERETGGGRREETRRRNWRKKRGRISEDGGWREGVLADFVLGLDCAVCRHVVGGLWGPHSDDIGVETSAQQRSHQIRFGCDRAKLLLLPDKQSRRVG